MSNQDHVENNQKNSKKSQVSIPNPSPDFVGESSATPEKEQQSAAAATHRSNPGETGSTAPKNQPVRERSAYLGDAGTFECPAELVLRLLRRDRGDRHLFCV